MADRFAVGIGAGKTWTSSDTALWSASDGGASGASVPGIGDVAIFNANSGGSGAYAVSLNYSPTCDINFAGISAAVPLIIKSSAKGTARTITASSVTVANYVHFQDIVGAGAGSWDISAVQSGDAGGNSGITFSPAQTNYWIGSAGNASDVAEWANASGGASSSGRVPLPQDSARVDANSGTGTITQNMPRTGGWSFVGSASIEWTTSTAASFFGSINLTDLATLTASTQTYTYEGRGASTLTSAGKSWAKPIRPDCVSGTLTSADALITTTDITLFSGTFDTGSYAITSDNFGSSSSTVRALNMGSSTWTITGGTGNLWNVATSTNLTLDAGTSTILLNGTLTAVRSFLGGGKTYYRLENATTGAFALQITGSNTFSNGIYIDASAAARTVQFTAGTTTTLGGLGINRDAGSNMITIESVTAATHTLSKASGTVSLHDVTITNSIATQADTFYAGDTPPSVDGGGTTNWIFTAAPGGGGGNFLLLGVSA